MVFKFNKPSFIAIKIFGGFSIWSIIRIGLAVWVNYYSPYETNKRDERKERAHEGKREEIAIDRLHRETTYKNIKFVPSEAFFSF